MSPIKQPGVKFGSIKHLYVRKQSFTMTTILTSPKRPGRIGMRLKEPLSGEATLKTVFTRNVAGTITYMKVLLLVLLVRSSRRDPPEAVVGGARRGFPRVVRHSEFRSYSRPAMRSDSILKLAQLLAYPPLPSPRCGKPTSSQVQA